MDNKCFIPIWRGQGEVNIYDLRFTIFLICDLRFTIYDFFDLRFSTE